MKKSNWNKMLLLDALFEGGRMLVGAISVVYLLANGQSLAFIATLKLIQSITLIISEVPTGVYCDSHGRKKGLMWALSFGCLGFACYASKYGSAAFIAGEIFLALTLSFWSGAYESFAIDQMKLKHREIDKFFHTNGSINRIAVMLFGLIGGFIAAKSNAATYWSAFAIFLMAIIYLKFNFEEKEHHQKIQRPSLKEATMSALSLIKENKALHPYIALTVVLQLLLVPMLHYWQPLFSNGQNAEVLGVVFMAYVGTGAFFSILFAKYAKSELIQSNTMKIMVILAALSSHIWVSLSESTWSLLVSFCLLQASVGVGRTMISASINKIIEAKYRASILSSISLISRFGSMASLALIGIGLSKLQGVQVLFQVNSILMIIVSIILTHKIVHNSGDIYANEYN